MFRWRKWFVEDSAVRRLSNGDKLAGLALSPWSHWLDPLGTRSTILRSGIRLLTDVSVKPGLCGSPTEFMLLKSSGLLGLVHSLTQLTMKSETQRLCHEVPLGDSYSDDDHTFAMATHRLSTSPWASPSVRDGVSHSDQDKTTQSLSEI
ncbi:unnamed protein product [Pleuronectes platessa]|uniref:Uncharacterized protein n=1 Tax=Pleuronectes platessa TaxID=8262 RepID=A0A9N7Z5D1_PLEPL|nr:unnamed protein product [Pleuronectes platessa]